MSPLILLIPELKEGKDWSMESLEISAKTVEEAIQQALDQLGVSREEVEVTVLSEGRRGVLGLGVEEATVSVRPLMAASKNETAEIVKDIIEALLANLGLDASAVPYTPSFVGEEAAPLAFDIKGEDLGILIGRRGENLASLQYLVRLIVAHKVKSRVPVIVDVEGYKQRRYESLQAMAQRIADQVQTRNRAFTLNPMPAFERRIIHITLAEHPRVTTKSIGEGEDRRVVIEPKRQRTINRRY